MTKKNALPQDQGENGPGNNSSAGTSSATSDVDSSAANIGSSEQPLNQAGSQSDGLPGAAGGVELHQTAQLDALEYEPQAVKNVPCLIVAARNDGFRRAGRAWSKTPCAIRADSLSKELADALLAEPELVVTSGMVHPDQAIRV